MSEEGLQKRETGNTANKAKVVDGAAGEEGKKGQSHN